MIEKSHPVAVIGAGVMGIGITQCLLTAGYSVILYDNAKDVSLNVKEQLKNNIRIQSLLSKEVKDVQIDIERQVTLTNQIADVQNAGIVIENVYEDYDEKKNVYKQLDAICSSDCIFMANTSCISITKLGACTKRPGKVIGTHFMNPVFLIGTVEVIMGYHTTNETAELTAEFLRSLSKKQVVIKDSPGFVSNRISHLMMNEAAFLLQEGVADASSIDEIFRQCYGHKMGPLETADLIGLDTVVMSLDVLYNSFHDSKFRCCPLLRKMVDAGLCGKKTEKGFYDYRRGASNE